MKKVNLYRHRLRKKKKIKYNRIIFIKTIKMYRKKTLKSNFSKLD